MPAKTPQRPKLPPDPLGDALAACYRQLLAQLAQEAGAQMNLMVGIDGALGENRAGANVSVTESTTRIEIRTE